MGKINNNALDQVVFETDTDDDLKLQVNGATSLRINANLALGLGNTSSYGTSGQVLTSNGTATAPSWKTLPLRTTGQIVLSSNTTLDSTHFGGNILATTANMVITLPTDGADNGTTVLISNISTGPVFLTYAFSGDGPSKLADGASIMLIADGNGNTVFWREYLESTHVINRTVERTTVAATAMTGTINVDLVGNTVQYFTSNASANWTFNFRANSTVTANSYLSNGETTSVVLMVTNGGTAYYPNNHTVDGSAVTPKWQGGTAPTAGNANSVDIYTYSIIKTAANTYTLLASQAKFA